MVSGHRTAGVPKRLCEYNAFTQKTPQDRIVRSVFRGKNKTDLLNKVFFRGQPT